MRKLMFIQCIVRQVLFPGPIRMPLCIPPDQILSSNSQQHLGALLFFSLSVVRQNSIPFTNHDRVAQTSTLNISSGSGTSNKIQRLYHVGMYHQVSGYRRVASKHVCVFTSVMVTADIAVICRMVRRSYTLPEAVHRGA